MKRLTNSGKEIPTLIDNAEYWLQVYFKLKDYEDLEEQDRLVKLPKKYRYCKGIVYQSETDCLRRSGQCPGRVYPGAGAESFE